MTSAYYHKMSLTSPFASRAVPNEFCRKLTYTSGATVECLEPTKAGATYCPACARHLLTLTDRPAPETQTPKKHSWREPMLRRSA